MEKMKMTGVKIGFFALILTLVIIGTVGVYAAVSPPVPVLSAPSNDALFTIESITLKWNTIPHDNGYYWVNWARAEDMNTWLAPPTARIKGTECTLSKEYVRDRMVYNGHTDTFYWRVQAEVDVSYYWPESWSPYSESWCFNILKWPAAWIDNNYWECYTTDSYDSLKGVNGETYTKLLQWGRPDTGWWESVGNGAVPITVSPNAHLSWSDRSTDTQQKSVTFADYYRIQIAASSSFNDTIVNSTSENIYYVTPELSPGAYYWRVRSETHDGLVTDWNSPRKFIISAAPQIPTSISCSVSSFSLAVGSSVTISGSIVPAYSGSMVTISYRSDGPWSILGTVTSGPDGNFAYSWTPSSPGSYQFMASWEGGNSYSGATSDATPVTVKVSTTITCTVSPSEVTVGGSVAVSGSISPAVSGATVTLTYTKPDATIITRAATSGSGGSYSDTYKHEVTGSWSVSASWAGDSTHAGASTSSTSFTVKKSGCFIATATYGSELSPQVQFLRGFRDNTVSSTFAGSSFMTVFNAFYYSFSPGVASTISDNGVLREAMKIILYPLIGILGLSSLIFSLFSFSPELGVVMAGLVASSLIAVVYVVPWVLLLSFLKKFRISKKTIRFIGLIWVGDVVALALAETQLSTQIIMAASGAFVIVTICLATLVTTKAVMEHYKVL
jgi:hypothetical protein